MTVDPLMPCSACAVLDCMNCKDYILTEDGERHPCPCQMAGHDTWSDDEDSA